MLAGRDGLLFGLNSFIFFLNSFFKNILSDRRQHNRSERVSFFFFFFGSLLVFFFLIYWTVPGVTARPTANGTCSMLMDCEATFTAALPFKVAAIRTAGWTDGNEENCITIGHSAVFLLFRFFFVVHQVCVCVCVCVGGR